MNLQEKLERLRELEDRILEATREQREERARIQAMLDRANHELEAMCPELRDEATALATEIMSDTKALGQTVKGAGYTVQYRSGYPRIFWDTKGLEGYAKRDPTILEFRTVKMVSPTARFKK